LWFKIRVNRVRRTESASANLLLTIGCRFQDNQFADNFGRREERSVAAQSNISPGARTKLGFRSVSILAARGFG